MMGAYIYKFLNDKKEMYLIEDREEEKKYHLRHRYINKRRAFLLVNDNWECSLEIVENDYEEPKSEKTKFTKEEIEHIKEFNGTDLSDFKEVEVEE